MVIAPQLLRPACLSSSASAARLGRLHALGPADPAGRMAQHFTAATQARLKVCFADFCTCQPWALVGLLSCCVGVAKALAPCSRALNCWTNLQAELHLACQFELHDAARCTDLHHASWMHCHVAMQVSACILCTALHAGQLVSVKASAWPGLPHNVQHVCAAPNSAHHATHNRTARSRHLVLCQPIHGGLARSATSMMPLTSTPPRAPAGADL